MSDEARYLLVSHDAGGAELLAAWARENLSKMRFSVCAEGPAKSVFYRNGFSSLLGREEVGNLRSFKSVITGSSWSSDLEKFFVRAAKSLGIPVVTYLDHWKNFRSRFAQDGTEVFPDEIWVQDQAAFEVARSELPIAPERIRIERNRYLEAVVRDIRNLSNSPRTTGRVDRPRILVVTEPVSEAAFRQHGDPRAFGYTEYEALDLFKDWLKREKIEPESLLLRPHPAESKQKYSGWNIAPEQTLAEAVAHADWVVGFESAALVVAAQAGRRVLSILPGNVTAFSLPKSGIERLFHSDAEC